MGGVKSVILADHVTKHLVYRSGEIPRGTSNWLLDLELAYGVFTADKTSMLQQELGLNDPALAVGHRATPEISSVPTHGNKHSASSSPRRRSCEVARQNVSESL